MAKIYKNPKGFKIIQLTLEEANTIWGKLGRCGVCDICNKVEYKCYFVACLNYYMCQKCFKEWIKQAEYYPEDSYFENLHFKHTVSLLKQNNLWSDK